MDDITKKMCKQLSENYYTSNKKLLFEQPTGAVPSAPADAANPSKASDAPEASKKDANADVRKFTPDNTFLGTFIDEIKTYVSSGNAEKFSLIFDDLTFDKNSKRVVWSGKFGDGGKMQWKVIYQKNGSSGVYLNITNEKAELDEIKTLNLICNYLYQTFLNKIDAAIDDKTLESEQTK